MFMKATDTFDPWTGPATSAFRFWISFWPTAPLFGVEWRFADTMADFDPLAGFTAARTVEAAKTDDVAEAVAAPVAEETPAAAPAAAPESPKPVADTPDDLTVIKGIGPGLARQLNAMGVTRLDQIAAFTDEDLARIDAGLTAFRGRCFRDDWVGQAKALLG